MVKKMTVKEYMNRKNEVKRPKFLHKIIVLLIVASLIIVIARNNENAIYINVNSNPNIDPIFSLLL